MTAQQSLHAYATRKDPAAFRQIVEAYQGLVYSAAGRRLARQQDIEDVVQLTFLKLAHAAHTIQHDLASWLYSTAVNAANDLIRRDSTRRRHEIHAAEQAHRIADDHQALHRLLHQVDEAILKLPIDQQTLIVEHFLRGKSQRELAEELSISQATISRRMDAAVRQLRQALGREGLGAAPSMIVIALQHLPQTPVPPLLTAQIAKIGLAGAGAKVTALSIWVSTLGTGTKVAIAASLVVVLGTGAAITTAALRSTSHKPAGAIAFVQVEPQTTLPETPAPANARASLPRPPQISEVDRALIRRIREVYASILPATMAITSTHRGPLGESMSFVRFAADADRLDFTADQFIRKDGVLRHNVATRQIWDGRLLLSRATTPARTPGDSPLRASFSQDPRSRQRLAATREIGPFLAGIIQMQPVADILEAATLRPTQTVQLDGASCLLLSGTAPIGAFQFWIDERSGLLRKAILDQKSGDLHWNDPLPRELSASAAGPLDDDDRSEAIVACHFEVADVRIERLGETWVPLAGTCTETLTYRRQTPDILVETVERTDYRHRPDFASIRAFEMDGLSEGQRLTRARLSPKDPADSAAYFWQGGKIITAAGAPLPSPGPER